MNRLETVILKNLIYSDEYTRKVIPFISEDYFSDNTEKIIFKEINKFVNEYKVLPTHEALIINLSEKSDITEDQFKKATNLLKDLHNNRNELSEIQWLTEQTEKFCQDKAIFNAVMESVQIMDDKTGKRARGEIPKLLSDALGVSFDTHVGHDYLDDSDSRYDFYHRKEAKIPFDLELFNKITKGGLSPKTLNMILAGVNVGKSLFMCHAAASYLSLGKNVLYITMEMAEERIAERIDANLMNIKIDDLHNIPKSDFARRFSSLKSKTHGKLIIKEYPTASAHAGHFRALLNELKIKKNFKPDIIVLDYLNICCSSRVKQGASVNSYTYVKSIAEELRGLAQEFELPILSATQTTRSGFTNSDIGMEDVSESFGLAATCDLLFALISTDELEALNQMLVKQLKNRYADKSYYKKFVIGVDKSKMRLYDAEPSAQQGLSESGQDSIPDRPLNTFGDRERQSKFAKFEGIKV